MDFLEASKEKEKVTRVIKPSPKPIRDFLSKIFTENRIFELYFKKWYQKRPFNVLKTIRHTTSLQNPLNRHTNYFNYNFG